MADTGIDDLREDLPMSMAIAAFTGISWFIGAEINTSLFILFKRRRGLYFWSATLCSWGVVLQPLFIILADYRIWSDLKGSITMIYLTWLIMVVPQSWLLYSRLHLIAHHETMLRWIKLVLIFTSIVFTVPTIIMGIISQTSDISPGLFRIYLAWDRTQVTVFFAQETILSLLYIWQARKYLRNSSLLSQPYLEPTSGGPTTAGRAARETHQVLSHLVLANILVIALDIALLGVQFADLFYLQGAFKPCVYGVKLKVEFAILNRLVEIVRKRGRGGVGSSYSYGSGLRAGVWLSKSTVGGTSSKPGGQSHAQIPEAMFGRQRQEDENPAENDRHEQIGLTQLDIRRAAGPSRSQSHESQDPIWDGPGHSRAYAETEAKPPTTVHRSQWRQVYHKQATEHAP
ncbi:hypothetical protein MMYC01_206967 [Madurella mycetomatis]|uniref:DUF7703 domain-containing protein n=1 Tax=Madurella mycetomatis TaxID=100816 RepID=A0A175W485_9PEZI|nr:hypothetical protein MMYC01_206967 [Madurella mycetomatis]